MKLAFPPAPFMTNLERMRRKLKKRALRVKLFSFAQMVKLVDMPDLGSGAARRVGSSPILGNNFLKILSRKETLYREGLKNREYAKEAP